MDSHSSNSQSRGSVKHGSKKKSTYANVVTSSRKEYAYDRPAIKCHCNKFAKGASKNNHLAIAYDTV
ncbi:hypothetical protein J1N35_019109 [Gossypium stocksii]|uniref:Uncharacterized protein n=1 Tax=Gossypium stocksii TaxID=47602 RepID=A0A9D4A5K5_9ROSI|nr:hypothetical protein J1N35_019109 [Gossypium stocksii]